MFAFFFVVNVFAVKSHTISLICLRINTFVQLKLNYKIMKSYIVLPTEIYRINMCHDFYFDNIFNALSKPAGINPIMVRVFGIKVLK
jgi:hypothetical protein